ncbi:Mediator complex subunit Med12 [Trinorchestia longiramus]|nr:Mediator complex subunit Med12 [Trinorchestia longiramus]
MMVVPSAEHRPLKRPKLGPPDVYPQDAKQREDELDDLSVKQGYTHRPQIQDEYGSALSVTLNSSKVAESFNSILEKKAELNQLPDTGRKKQQINIKDFWLVIPRLKVTIEAWFKDLAGSKPLTFLAKKVPIFPKREDMLLTLCEYAVPTQRAIWFIKMTFFYHESKALEIKAKKRPQLDLSLDMTGTLTRFLREQLCKISEAYGTSASLGYTTSGGSTPSSSSNPPGSTPPGSSTPSSSQPPHSSPHQGIGSSGSSSPSCAQLSHNLRNWNYIVQIAHHMYQDGLLDRQEFLEWVVDSITRYRTAEQDSVLRVVLPLGLQYLDEITQSEYLSRKLTFFAANKLNHMCQENGYTPATGSANASTSPTAGNGDSSSTGVTSAISAPPQPSVSSVGASVGASVNSFIQSSASASRVFTSGASHGINPALATTFQELLSCHQHRPILLALCAYIQAVCLDCPTAFVWNYAGDRRNYWLSGSPLDHLPCSPSQLPMPPRQDNHTIRSELRRMEEHLKQRTRAGENRWSMDKYGRNITGFTIHRVLLALDALDRHAFDKVEALNSLDTLYTKIFTLSKDSQSESNGPSGSGGASGGSGSGSSGSGGSGGCTLLYRNHTHATVNTGKLKGGTWPECGDGWEDAVVTTICEWAVTMERCGEHRAVVAARLIEKRQSFLLSQAEAGATNGSSSSSSSYYPFQNLLLKFLDVQAPVFDDLKGSDRSREFGNLVLLFSELIRHDVFSHDGYMCTLISRGDLADPPALLNPPALSSTCPEVKEEKQRDTMDDDLDKILLNITTKDEEAGHDTSPHHDLSVSSAMMEDGMGGGITSRTRVLGAEPESLRKQPPRHLVYAQHFPLPSDDSYSHETNQRYVLLYGVGKARDEARHAVKKLTKEIQKLFSKKFSNDVAEGGKVKKSSRGEFSFESLLSRFSLLSYFDQHCITSNVAAQVLEMLCGCGSGNSNYLPLLDHVAFLMDLMETGLNIHGLLQLCVQLIKEIVDIEAVLTERGSLSGYCPQLTLLVIGVLRKYSKWLLVSQDQTLLVFERLLRLVKHVSNPSECTSAERIVFSYLHNLYNSCSFIKAKHSESFAPLLTRIRAAFNCTHTSDGKHRRNPHVLEDYISNPKLRVDIPLVKQQLAEPANRYSFACSAVMAAVTATSNTRLNDIAVMCAEMTACCTALNSEWLGILNVLCSSVSSANLSGGAGGVGSNNSPYSDVVAAVDLRDPRTAAAAHASLSVFTAVLIARDCFSFEELLDRVVVHSLKAAWNNGKGNPEVEPGARLSCHLLLRIFQSIDSSQPAQYCPGSPSSSSSGVGGSSGGGAAGAAQRNVRLSCDRHLLVAAHLTFNMEPVLAFLKAMLVVSDAMSGQSKSSSSSISDILGTSCLASSEPDPAGVEKAPLSDFARYALHQICSQDWVREICLKCPEKLCNSDNLLDNILTPSQAQRVLHHICHPESSNHNTSGLDQSSVITSILSDLDEWRLRISWLDLHLMYEQLRSTSSELNQWLENVSHATIQMFCQDVQPASVKQQMSLCKGRRRKLSSLSLVAPLISRLPRVVQSRVLKACGDVLNSVNFGAYSSHKLPVVPQPGSMPGGGGGLNGVGGSVNSLSGMGGQGSAPSHSSGGVGGCFLGISDGCSGGGRNAQVPVQNQRPFLRLMLMCLEAAQDDTLSDLLENLRMQLMQPVTLYREICQQLGRNRGEVDPHKRRLMLEALRLRFGLIGGLFDVILACCSNVIISEWAIQLVQLVVSGVIDLTNNSELFTTVLDMLAALIHSTLVSDPGTDTREENKRQYYNLVKKIKKASLLACYYIILEVGELNNVSLRLVRQLIPLPKVQMEVVVMEPWGSITDKKGNWQQDFDKDTKHGVQGVDKQKLSPWDLLEGHRSPAPMSWAWLAATRLTRKTLKYHDTHQLLRFHTHTLQKPLSYFLEPPPLPPEDLEPVPEKQNCVEQVLLSQLPGLKEEVKAPDTPTSDHSPRANTKRGGASGGTAGKGSSSRKRKARPPPTLPPMNQAPMPMNFQQPNYGGVGGGPVTGGMPQVSQWGSSYPPQPQQQQPQPPQQQPQPYYQQLPPGQTFALASLAAARRSCCGGSRYPVFSQSRNAIRQVLLERQHSGMSGGIVGAGQNPQQQQAPPGFATMGAMMNPHQTSPMIRQQLRGAMAARPQPGGLYTNPAAAMQGAMAARQSIPGQPGQMYNPGAGGPGAQGVNSSPAAAMAAQYGGYQQGPMMNSAGVGASGASMMGHSYQQGGYQGPSMLGMRTPQQTGYMSQGQIVQRPQYMQTTSGAGSMGMMSGGQAYARPGMGGMAGGGGGATMAGGGTMSGGSLGPGGGMGGGGGGGAMGGAGAGGPESNMMHHRMMMGAVTTTSNTNQQSQLMSHMQRPMPQQQQPQQQQPQQQQQQQQTTGQPQQQAQQQNQQAQRQTMMGQGRGYPQPPY